MEWIRAINYIIAVSGLSLSLMGLVLTVSVRYLEPETRGFFISFFSLISLYVFLDFTGQITSIFHTYGWAIISRLLLFVESLVSSFLTVMTTGFLLHQCGEKKRRRNPIMRTSVALWILYFILLVYTQFSGALYSIDNNNVYRRGPYYPVLLIPPVLIMLLNLILLWQKKDRLSVKQQRAFKAYALIPMVSMLIQMFFFGVYAIVLGTSIAGLFMISYIISDQVEKYMQKEEENSRLKIDILLAQIQPHFLYNSLTTIKFLCKRDPDTAEQAVTDFTEYLRHNMESLTMDRPIPFESELEHVRGYLALQQLRFKDELKVEYDLECRDFMIPTLTLQPLVENAVSYGIRKSESGEGVVTIRSRRYPDRVEVSVLDDGPGFDPMAKPDDTSRSHLGIQNVKERLARIAGGELRVESVIGSGTTVTMILPEKQ